MNKIKTLGLVFSSSIIVNLGFLSSTIYDVPGIFTTILLPGFLVICIGWFQRNIMKTITLTFALILTSSILLLLSLSAPVLLGIIVDPGYRQVFIYTAFLKVVQYMLLTSFFSLFTALLAGLAFE